METPDGPLHEDRVVPAEGRTHARIGGELLLQSDAELLEPLVPGADLFPAAPGLEVDGEEGERESRCRGASEDRPHSGAQTLPEREERGRQEQHVDREQHARVEGEVAAEHEESTEGDEVGGLPAACERHDSARHEERGEAQLEGTGLGVAQPSPERARHRGGDDLRARREFVEIQPGGARIAGVAVPQGGGVGVEQRLVRGRGSRVQRVAHGPREPCQRGYDRRRCDPSQDEAPPSVVGRATSREARNDQRGNQERVHDAHPGREPDAQAQQELAPEAGAPRRPALEAQAAEERGEPRHVGHHLVRETPEAGIEPDAERD